MIQIILTQLKSPSGDALPAQFHQKIDWLTKLVSRSAIGSSLWLGLGWMPTVIAQPTIVPDTPEICEVNFNLLKSDRRSERDNIITADTASAKGMTLPSLWWTNEQLPPKLVTNWIANRQQKQVYLLVNAQYWDLLDYIDRYQTIDKFGRVAQGYGYNLKLCSSQKVVLAQYHCDPIVGAAEPVATRHASCQLSLNASGQNSLGVQTGK
jgi:hypothetical protein